MKRINTICIDFDSTLVEMAYPNVGEIIPNAFETLKWLQKHNINLVLFTMRSGVELKDAVDFCKEQGIEFYGVNKNPGQHTWTSSPKAFGDLYIDDCGINCPLIYPNNGSNPYVDWVKVKEILKPMIEVED